jgi:hypothetical protein
MATSPNYGWSEPDNTSLVKDGALAMRTLGDAIDTSVWNVGYGQAGKNKIINGDFSINQRAFTSITTDATYTFDRWRLQTEGDGSCTASPQVFTPGAAPVAGYESTNFIRLLTASQTSASVRSILAQRIESVRTFAGQTVTYSFWAKAASGTPKLYIEPQQQFGSGGSPSGANTQTGQQITISTSWVRYSATFNIDSISGKTIGTDNNDYLQFQMWVSAGSDYNARTNSLGLQNNTFDIWGVQVEYGSIATPFQTASGGSIQNELAMCQRYYYKHGASGGTNAGITSGGFYTASTVIGVVNFPVTMRTGPTMAVTSGTNFYQAVSGNGLDNLNSFTQDSGNTNASQIFNNSEASGNIGYYANLISNNASSSIAWSAEL